MATRATPIYEALTSYARGHPLPPPFASRSRPSSHSGGWKAISLFSGGGGLDLGFAFEGIQTIRAYELDAAACRVHAANLDGQTCRQDLSVPIAGCPKAEVLLAGAPCQGFSTLGKRNAKDPRNGLLSSIVAASEVLRPRLIVIENVPAALSGSVQNHWLRMEQALRNQGLNVRRFRLDASEHGVPQIRKRLFVVAWRGSGHIQPTFPSRPRVTTGEGIAGLDCDDRIFQLPNREQALIARRIAQGQKLSNVRFSDKCVHTWDIPEVFGAVSEQDKVVLRAVGRLRRRKRTRDHGDGDPVTIERLNEATGLECDPIVESLIVRQYLKHRDHGVEMYHTFNGKYRRIDPDSQSPTVDTHFGRMTNFVHPNADRAMTLRETLRLQGFPDWYSIAEAPSPGFRICGNAVPPPLAASIASVVREAILKA